MARRKRSKARSIVRYKTAKKAGYKRRKRTSSVKAIQPMAMLYGATSQYTSNMVAKLVDSQPLLAKIPANLGDELVRGTISWLAAKKGSGMVKQIGQVGLTVENARVGMAAVNMVQNRSTSGTISSGYVYG